MPITKRPCANCPFRCDGAAIELRPGRLEGIVQGLIASDTTGFQCHKTLGSKETMQCAGAVGVLTKMGRMPVIARLGLLVGVITKEDVEASMALVIDPGTLNIETRPNPRRRSRGLNDVLSPRRSAAGESGREAAAESRPRRRRT